MTVSDAPAVDSTVDVRRALRQMALCYPLAVAVTVAGVAVIGVPSVHVQAVVAAIGVLFFGLPHGAVDPLVARKLRLSTGPAGWLGFSVGYVGLAIVSVVFWVMAPTSALLLFLVISAWHFGGDWAPTIVGFDRLIVGIALLCSTTLFHRTEVQEVLASLVSAADASLIASSMFAVACMMLPVAGCLPFKPEIRSTAPRVPIIATLCAALALPPLLFFTVYFCGYHSPKHLRQSLSGLKSVPLPRINQNLVMNTLISVPIMVMASAYTIEAEHLVQSAWLQFVFIGLFALTVPHLVLEEIRKVHEKEAGGEGESTMNGYRETPSWVES